MGAGLGFCGISAWTDCVVAQLAGVIVLNVSTIATLASSSSDVSLSGANGFAVQSGTSLAMR